MPKIDIPAIPVRTGTGYPPPYDAAVAGRSSQALGDAAGLTKFGVNLVRLAPGAWSSQRHWHPGEDEFVYVLEGEPTLVGDAGETLLHPGDAVGFAKGVADGHHLINRSPAPVCFLVVGARHPGDDCHYPDADLFYDGAKAAYVRKNGKPFA